MLRIRLKQEAAVAECNVASLRQIEVLRQSMNIHFSEALWLLSCKYLYTIEGIVYTNLTIEHQVVVFPFSFVTYYVYCLGNSALYYVFILFSFSVLHACFCYFIRAYQCTLHGFFGFLLPTCPASTWTFPCQSFSCSYV